NQRPLRWSKVLPDSAGNFALRSGRPNLAIVTACVIFESSRFAESFRRIFFCLSDDWAGTICSPGYITHFGRRVRDNSCVSRILCQANCSVSNGRAAMDCDQVFMILTCGPFPTGQAWDEQVEAHLESCADCWRLAEALRPALEVFQEAVPPAESRELPGYWGDARPAGLVLSQITHSATRTAAV